jgi:glycosyltransferase involved in cell wall biosynthesis
LPRLLSVSDLDATEIIVVDDGSSDRTAAVAVGLLNDVRHGAVLRLDRNAGKGAAVRAGVAHARGTSTVFMDADLATDPRDIGRLLGGLDRADVVIGSRAAAGATVENAPVMRAVMGWTFNRFLRSATGLELRDTQCGFKAFRTSTARLLFGLSKIDGFAIDVELLLLARGIGLVVEEVPVRWRHQQGSQVSPIRDSLAMLSDVVRLRRDCLKAIPDGAVQWRAERARLSSAISVAFDSVQVIDS